MTIAEHREEIALVLVLVAIGYGVLLWLIYSRTSRPVSDNFWSAILSLEKITRLEYDDLEHLYRVLDKRIDKLEDQVERGRA